MGEELPLLPWKPVAHRWEENLAKLRQYKECHGHTRVPARWGRTGRSAAQAQAGLSSRKPGGKGG